MRFTLWVPVPPITVWLPALAALFIATIAGGLGVIFMVLHGTLGDRMPDSWGKTGQETPVIILGLAIVLLVPTIAALVHLWLNRRSS